MGWPSCPLAPQVVEELSLEMKPAPLKKMLPDLRAFPCLAKLNLEGDVEENWVLVLTSARLRQLPALEGLTVVGFGRMSLSEPLPRLTSLEVRNGHRLEVGAEVTLPSLRCLTSEAVGTVVLRGSLPQLTWLHIEEDTPNGNTAHVSVGSSSSWPLSLAS